MNFFLTKFNLKKLKVFFLNRCKSFKISSVDLLSSLSPFNLLKIYFELLNISFMFVITVFKFNLKIMLQAVTKNFQSKVYFYRLIFDVCSYFFMLLRFGSFLRFKVLFINKKLYHSIFLLLLLKNELS